MTFSPTPAAGKGAGQDLQRRRCRTRAASTGCTCARTLPSSIAASTSARFMRARSTPRDLRRAEAVFQENLPRSFGIELADLSRDRWSVIPEVRRSRRGDEHRPRAPHLHEVGERRRGHPVLRSHAQPDDRDLSRRRKSSRRAARFSTKTTRSTSTSSTTTSMRASIRGANGSTERPRCC